MRIRDIAASSLLLAIVVLSGCFFFQKTLEPKGFVLWMRNEENGLRRKRQVDDYVFTAQYKNWQYILAAELAGGKIKKEEVNARKEKIVGMQYYDLTIDVANLKQTVLEFKATKENYQARLDYFMFGMKDDVYLLEGDEKISCKLYHYERAYNLNSHTTFLLAFDQRPDYVDSTKVLVIDPEILGVGEMRIEFNREDISKIPLLKLQ